MAVLPKFVSSVALGVVSPTAMIALFPLTEIFGTGVSAIALISKLYVDSSLSSLTRFTTSLNVPADELLNVTVKVVSVPEVIVAGNVIPPILCAVPLVSEMALTVKLAEPVFFL